MPQPTLLRAAAASTAAATRRAMSSLAAGPRSAAAPAPRRGGRATAAPGTRSPPRGPPVPRARGGSAAMRELMQSRDDRRADKLEAKAPTVTTLEWPRPLTVIRYPDPRLRAVNATIGVFDEKLRALAADMLAVMYDDEGGDRDSGVGLAAPQVGVNVRMMVFNPTGDRARADEEVVLVNPRLVSTGGGLVLGEEGCLSFPGVYGDVARPARAKVRAQRLDGTTFQVVLDGFPARVFLHEFDHLQGVLFHDRMEPASAAGAAPRLRALEEAWAREQGQAAV